jgi:hypothetical protein
MKYGLLILSVLLSSQAYGLEDGDELEALAIKHAPLIYFHPDEAYLPTSLGEQLPYLSLYKKGELSTPIMKDLNLTIFEDWVNKTPATKDYSLRIRPEFQKIAKKGNLKKAECYAYPHQVERDGHSYIEIPYLIYYGYNGIPRSRNPLWDAFFQWQQFGIHEGDWEHINVILDQETKNITGIFYAAHGQGEARYYTQEGTSLEVDPSLDDGYKLRDGRPVVFSALETHASYNRTGFLARSAHRSLIEIFASITHILPSDKTAMGLHLDCKEMGRLQTFHQKEKTWADYQGDYGGPTGPGGKSFWKGKQNLVIP